MKIEKKVLASLVIFFYLLVFQFAIVPNWETVVKIRNETAALKKELDNLVAFNSRYRWWQNELEATFHKDSPSNLLSVIEKKADNLNLSAKLKAVTPFRRDLTSRFRLEGFDINLEGVNLKEVVLFTEAVEEEKGVFLDRLALEKSKDGMSLSARLRFLTFEKL